MTNGTRTNTGVCAIIKKSELQQEAVWLKLRVKMHLSTIV